MVIKSESSGFDIENRRSILCGVADEMIVIKYGDATVGMSERVVTVEDVYVAVGSIFLEGFCHTRGETRTFRFDRIHSINELPLGGYFTSVTEWMRSYGVEIAIYKSGRSFKYRLADIRDRRT